jgi:hypothetical protein
MLYNFPYIIHINREMVMKTIFDLCVPRDEVTKGNLSQYHRQLWAGGRLKNWVNSAQSGDLLENVSQ